MDCCSGLRSEDLFNGERFFSKSECPDEFREGVCWQGGFLGGHAGNTGNCLRLDRFCAFNLTISQNCPKISLLSLANQTPLFINPSLPQIQSNIVHSFLRATSALGDNSHIRIRILSANSFTVEYSYRNSWFFGYSIAHNQYVVSANWMWWSVHTFSNFCPWIETMDVFIFQVCVGDLNAETLGSVASTIRRSLS